MRIFSIKPTVALFTFGLAASFTAHASTEKIDYSFEGGADGALPTNTLLYAKRAFYGTAAGPMFKVTPKGADTTLASGIVSFSPLIKMGTTLYGLNNAGNGRAAATGFSRTASLR